MSAVKKSHYGKPESARVETLVLGLGMTGLSVARFLKRQGIDARFADSRTEPPGLHELQDLAPGAELILGRIDDAAVADITRIVVSPGVADSEPLLKTARAAGVEVVSDIELFAREARAPIVAVTGSNGKSTVTTLLSLMCEAAGLAALAGANLGEPALDLLVRDKADFYLLELSSFQLQRTNKLPAKVAVLLNISADHLDWHDSEEDYRKAKYRIFEHAAAAVINRADPDMVRHVGKDTPYLTFGLDAPEEGHYGLLMEDGAYFLARGEQLLIATADLAMVGRHNQLNALAALAAGELMGLELAAMLQVLPEFPGLPHRMQLVAHKGGVDYINDSKATNTGAAVASIESIDGDVVLIAGGQSKGGDFDNLSEALGDRLRAAVLIGRDADQIADALAEQGPVYMAADIDEAVRRAAGFAKPGDTVLLAPACASFDQFPNFEARGEAFGEAVLGLPA
ncbi:MAG: UDP-N-acetylmuramoyl-L-alanine--D-glutamate ligase [Woeseia sp.]